MAPYFEAEVLYPLKKLGMEAVHKVVNKLIAHGISPSMFKENICELVFQLDSSRGAKYNLIDTQIKTSITQEYNAKIKDDSDKILIKNTEKKKSKKEAMLNQFDPDREEETVE